MNPYLAITAAMAIAGAATAFAADDPAKARQDLMKEVGAAMKTLGGTAKGELAYDAGAVAAAFTKMHDAAVAFPEQFPAGSETGHETEAAPAIWSDAAGFEAAAAKFAADTQAAIDAAPADADSFKPVFGKVASNCKACHEKFRVKK